MAEIVWYQVSKEWSPARTCTGSWDGYPQCFIVQRPECNLYCPYFCGKSTHVIHSQRVTQMEINGIRQLKANISCDNRCVLQTAGCGDTFRKTINDRNKVNSANSIPNRIKKGLISRCFVVLCHHSQRIWWRHQMETFSAYLAICAGNSPVTGEFSAQRPVMRSFDVFFDLCLNKRLGKQLWGWWFETPSHPLWRHCKEIHDALLVWGVVCRKHAPRAETRN